MSKRLERDLDRLQKAVGTRDGKEATNVLADIATYDKKAAETLLSELSARGRSRKN